MTKVTDCKAIDRIESNHHEWKEALSADGLGRQLRNSSHEQKAKPLARAAMAADYEAITAKS